MEDDTGEYRLEIKTMHYNKRTHGQVAAAT